MKKKRQKILTKLAIRVDNSSTKAPFVEHLKELKKRLFYIALSVIVWGGAAYVVQQSIVKILLKPSHGQNFVYTSPIGGIDFLFRVCIYTGLILSIPVLVYQILKFLSPLLNIKTHRFIALWTLVSGIFAVIGILFGYYVGLPAALHFLLHQFVTSQIKPLITIQSYISFVMVYMVGSALMLQIPLLVVLINRIKPQNPSKLFHYERWVILLAFIISGLMNPTPNVLDQLVVAGPIILMYQFSIGIVALINRPRWPKQIQSLFEEDQKLQANRFAVAQSTQPLTGSEI